MSARLLQQDTGLWICFTPPISDQQYCCYDCWLKTIVSAHSLSKVDLTQRQRKLQSSAQRRKAKNGLQYA
eukprot:3651207-Rhodomonas_salina.1